MSLEAWRSGPFQSLPSSRTQVGTEPSPIGLVSVRTAFGPDRWGWRAFLPSHSRKSSHSPFYQERKGFPRDPFSSRFCVSLSSARIGSRGHTQLLGRLGGQGTELSGQDRTHCQEGTQPPGKARGREMASAGACCPSAGWGSEPAVDRDSLCRPQPGWQRLVLGPLSRGRHSSSRRWTWGL